MSTTGTIDFAANIKASYSAADSLPIKLLQDYNLIRHVKRHGVITPVHAQFIPTNKCNLKCGFCSCSEEDRNVEMDKQTALEIIDVLESLGTVAVTITGGGEPLLHPDIKTIIEYFTFSGIAVGLVTNGLKLDVLGDTWGEVTWCRISHDDDRIFYDHYGKNLAAIIKDHPEVDWSFSHVVSPNPNFAVIKRVIEFANENGFKHVRLVADLLQYDKVDLNKVKEFLEFEDVLDNKVIYQDRNAPVHGGPCRISCLKPVIGADARVYPCCGVQYALEKPSRKLAEIFSLGDALNLGEIVEQYSGQGFDGIICRRCYYSGYNEVLGALMTEVAHADFV